MPSLDQEPKRGRSEKKKKKKSEKKKGVRKLRTRRGRNEKKESKGTIKEFRIESSGTHAFLFDIMKNPSNRPPKATEEREREREKVTRPAVQH
jgi:hypothetical protein